MTTRRFRHTALSSLALLGMLSLTACTLLTPAPALARVPPPVPVPNQPSDTDGQDDDLNNDLAGPGSEASVLQGSVEPRDMGAPIAHLTAFGGVGDRVATLAWAVSYLARL